MATLDFAEVIVVTIPSGQSSSINLDSGTVWKIESAGIGGTSGSVFLRNNASEQVAMLFSSVNEHDYGSPLPFWLNAGFQGSFLNDSSYSAAVSITRYSFTP